MSIESSENEEVISDPGSECVSDDSRVEQHSSAVFISTESEGENEASFHSFASFIESNLLLEIPPAQNYSTFKIVIAFLDLYIRPRSETSEHHAESKHFVNVYAVKDRISCSAIEDNTLHSIDLAKVNVEDVLPKPGDLDTMKQNLAIIACRIVQCHMKFFRKNVSPKGVPKHITHKFSKEMAQKSGVVSFHVLLMYY